MTNTLETNKAANANTMFQRRHPRGRVVGE